MCSASETFGMVTIEALARQIPIIGTNTGGTPELLANGSYGKLYEPGNHRQLAQALNSLENWPMPSPSQLKSYRQSKALKEWQKLLRHSRRSTL
jgi:glycosyltransferase involved in cell wall biosynthesis